MVLRKHLEDYVGDTLFLSGGPYSLGDLQLMEESGLENIALIYFAPTSKNWESELSARHGQRGRVRDQVKKEDVKEEYFSREAELLRYASGKYPLLRVDMQDTKMTPDEISQNLKSYIESFLKMSRSEKGYKERIRVKLPTSDFQRH